MVIESSIECLSSRCVPGSLRRTFVSQLEEKLTSYDVDKFWLVDGVLEDSKLRLVTRRGNVRVLDSNDPHLRKPRWWERLVYKTRFPQSED